MKNMVLSFLILFALLGCSDDENNEQQETSIYGTRHLKYSVMVDNTNELIFTQAYTFDNKGKVTSETYTDVNNPEHNHISEFRYNENGKLISEWRNNKIFTSIKWNNNVAEVYNANGQKISEFVFSNDKLIEYRIEYRIELRNNSIQQYRKFNYDSNQNVVSIENENEIFIEFLDYDTSKSNPLSLIQSIGILRIDYMPFFKNIFGVEKAYPYVGDDYGFPLTFYNYHYTFDRENRVFKIENNKTIYFRKFEYK